MPTSIEVKAKPKGKISLNSNALREKCNYNNSGHVLKPGEERSEDVSFEENISFSDMYLNDEIVSGLQATGFYKPSPVQLQAIPTGRCGLDLIVQAKSGTGKTCVFAVLALETVVFSASSTQVLVIAPTREIAVQIAGVINGIGRFIKDLKVGVFIGGTSVEVPPVCHIAVGTPGRLCHLLSENKLSGRNIRLLVLDEADQLLDNFKNDVQQLMAALPHRKQVICTSATYTPSLRDVAKQLMRSPVHVTLSSMQLLAVTQLVHKIPYTGTSNQKFKAKLLHLKGILGSTNFNQCMIFTNSVLKAESVTDSLSNEGWPVACLCGGQSQEQRLEALTDLVTHRCRIMVATDLAARGLDSPHVSLVVSLDPPPHPHTYLHRVGRAGRFGARGISVVLASQGDDWLHVSAIATVLDLRVLVLPEPSLVDVHRHQEPLPHLSVEQLEEWSKQTTHRLNYADTDQKLCNIFEVWKIKHEKNEQLSIASNNGVGKCEAFSPDSVENNIAVPFANGIETINYCNAISQAPSESTLASQRPHDPSLDKENLGKNKSILEIEDNSTFPAVDNETLSSNNISLLTKLFGTKKYATFSHQDCLKECVTLSLNQADSELGRLNLFDSNNILLTSSDLSQIQGVLEAADAAHAQKNARLDAHWNAAPRSVRELLKAQAVGEGSWATQLLGFDVVNDSEIKDFNFHLKALDQEQHLKNRTEKASNINVAVKNNKATARKSSKNSSNNKTRVLRSKARNDNVHIPENINLFENDIARDEFGDIIEERKCDRDALRDEFGDLISEYFVYDDSEGEEYGDPVEKERVHIQCAKEVERKNNSFRGGVRHKICTKRNGRNKQDKSNRLNYSSRFHFDSDVSRNGCQCDHFNCYCDLFSNQEYQCNGNEWQHEWSDDVNSKQFLPYVLFDRNTENVCNTSSDAEEYLENDKREAQWSKNVSSNPKLEKSKTRSTKSFSSERKSSFANLKKEKKKFARRCQFPGCENIISSSEDECVNEDVSQSPTSRARERIAARPFYPWSGLPNVGSDWYGRPGHCWGCQDEQYCRGARFADQSIEMFRIMSQYYYSLSQTNAFFYGHLRQSTSFGNASQQSTKYKRFFEANC